MERTALVVTLLKQILLRLREELEVTTHVITNPKLHWLSIILPLIVNILACSVCCQLEVAIRTESKLILGKSCSICMSELVTVNAIVTVCQVVRVCIICTHNRLINYILALITRDKLDDVYWTCLCCRTCCCITGLKRWINVTRTCVRLTILLLPELCRTLNIECEELVLTCEFLYTCNLRTE